ncbi:MAG TPA: lysozyme [Devosia sp.]|nr:lysozyme [Devosia sp.]
MATSRLRNLAGALTAAGLLAVAFVGGWEGLRLKSYPDIIGVWTACYGSTENIRPGMQFTKAQCDELLVDDLVEHEAGLRRCLKSPDTIPVKSYVAFVSWTFNVGVYNACHSTLVRKVNAGDVAGACNELPRWNRAGGKVVQGLINRRADERRLCLEGVGK